MRYKDFEDYLQQKFGEQYMGLDDEWPDEFEKWLSELDIQEVIDHANDWGKTL